MNTNKANKIFFIIFILLLIASISLTFYRIVILKDYQIEAEVSCDPEIESCFVWECSPEDDETCAENPEERISYYKLISKKAATIYACELTEEKDGCTEELSCVEGEENCLYTYCDAETEECSEISIE